MVRPGLILYGLYPERDLHGACEGLVPAMTLSSAVSLVKDIPAGTSVVYGRTEIAAGNMRLATVSAGYADGYPTLLSGKGEVIIKGKKARIVGRVCMDQFMVDVTDIPDVKQGDEVTIVGTDGNQRLTVEELAKTAGSFNYEYVCDITKRVPRVYIGGATIRNS
jgi:alanine racemase